MHVVRRVLAGPVAHSRLADIKRTGSREDRALGQVAVAHNAMAACVIAESIELGDDFGYFGFEGALEELPGPFADELVKGRDWTGHGCVRTFGHGAYLPSGP